MFKYSKRPHLLSLLITLLAITSLNFAFATTITTPVYAESKICQKQGDKDCIPQSTDPALSNDGSTCKDQNCLVDRYVEPAIKALSALVAVAATASIVYAGIQYTIAAGDASKIAASKKRILQTVFGLVAWIFLLALLNWLMPGGLF